MRSTVVPDGSRKTKALVLIDYRVSCNLIPRIVESNNLTEVAEFILNLRKIFT